MLSRSSRHWQTSSAPAGSVRHETHDQLPALRGHTRRPARRFSSSAFSHATWHRWEQEAADRVFLAERSGVGWREETYRSTLQKVRALASSLLARGLDAQTPILIMSGNGVDHGLIALAAQYAGIPTVPIAEQHSLIPGAHGRLLEVVELVRPKLAFVDDAERYGAALALGAFADIEVVASRPVGAAATSLDYLLRGDQSVDLTAAHAAVVRPCRLPKWH